MANVDIKETSGVVLAYLGDAIWELEVRKYFVNKGLNLKNLNWNVKNSVNAKCQSKIYEKIMPNLEERYQMLGNRAKNGNIKSFPRSCTNKEYRQATAFEALIAGFYLDNRMDLIEEALKICMEDK